MSHLIENHEVDTAALVFGAEEESPPVLLPLPMLPHPKRGTSYFEEKFIAVDSSSDTTVHGRRTSTSIVLLLNIRVFVICLNTVVELQVSALILTAFPH